VPLAPDPDRAIMTIRASGVCTEVSCVKSRSIEHGQVRRARWAQRLLMGVYG
jgi:hypothetical protein